MYISHFRVDVDVKKVFDTGILDGEKLVKPEITRIEDTDVPSAELVGGTPLIIIYCTHFRFRTL